MYGAINNCLPAFGGMIRVLDLQQIEQLVKESEVLTGKPGRKFVLGQGGQTQLSYRILWYPNGYRVHRLDSSDAPTCTIEMLQEQLLEHALGKALRDGYLFTPAN